MLMFIVVIFFLIYGVEVYFKVRGGFVKGTAVTAIANNNRKLAEDGGDATLAECSVESHAALFDTSDVNIIHTYIHTCVHMYICIGT